MQVIGTNLGSLMYGSVEDYLKTVPQFGFGTFNEVVSCALLVYESRTRDNSVAPRRKLHLFMKPIVNNLKGNQDTQNNRLHPNSLNAMYDLIYNRVCRTAAPLYTKIGTTEHNSLETIVESVFRLDKYPRESGDGFSFFEDRSTLKKRVNKIRLHVGHGWYLEGEQRTQRTNTLDYDLVLEINGVHFMLRWTTIFDDAVRRMGKLANDAYGPQLLPHQVMNPMTCISKIIDAFHDMFPWTPRDSMNVKFLSYEYTVSDDPDYEELKTKYLSVLWDKWSKHYANYFYNTTNNGGLQNV